MTDPRLEWYRRAIAADPVKDAKMEVAIQRCDSTPGTSDDPDVTLCSSCWSMTKTVDGICGKCRAQKVT